MKRPVFIIVASILVVILLIVWIYVLFFSAPPKPDNFADLNLNGTDEASSLNGTNQNPGDQPTVVVSGSKRLRQLTTKPVIGYQELVTETGSSTNIVEYIEAGTGHIFSIDLITGQERRVSGTTISTSRVGAITPDGRFVMIQSGSGLGARFIVGQVSSSTESIQTTALAENIVSFTSTADNTFLYLVQIDNTLVAKQYYPISNVSDTLFSIPFREAAIAWGSDARATHYTYTKPAGLLEGYLYQTKGKSFERTALPPGYGLSARGNDAYLIYSDRKDGRYRTFVYNMLSNKILPLNIITIPEKCTPLHSTDTLFVCARGEMNGVYNLPDTWFQGTQIFADDLWLVNPETASTTKLLGIEQESGRQLDVINLSPNRFDTELYFTNKNDQTLWAYKWSPGELVE